MELDLMELRDEQCKQYTDCLRTNQAKQSGDGDA